MAVVVNTTLKADTKDAVKQVEILKKEVEKVGKAAKKSGEDISAAMQIGNEATRALDKVSGGLASKLVKVAKAAKLSGKAMKTALISSGIGAAVVALGLIVEYWDDISEAIGLTNKDLEKHNELLELGSGVLDSEAAYYKERKKVLINSGQDISKINKEIAENEAKQLKNLDERIVNQRAIFDKANKAYSANRNEETRQAVVDAKKLAFALMTEREKIRNQKLEESTVVIDPKIRENEKRTALEAEKIKAAALERIRKGLIDTEAEERAEKLRLIQQDYTEQIKLAEKFYGKESDKVKELKAAAKVAELAQQKVFDDKDKATQKAKDIIEDEKTQKTQERVAKKLASENEISISKKRFAAEEIQDEVLRLEKLKEIDALEAEQETARLQVIVDNAKTGSEAKMNAEIALNEFLETARQNNLTNEKKVSDASVEIAEEERKAKQTALDGYAGAVSSLSNTIGQETAAGKGLAVASSLISTYAAITATLENSAKTAAGGIPGYAIAQSIATGIAGLAAVKKIMSVQVPGGRGGGSTQSASMPTAPTPPAFNIVGSSGETQLADAIGSQTQRPARAYVVSNDVTTAQEMDRNIIEGASIG
tara:strand:- start:2030 stop:3820 length:1791 start_codon:yes stop_codon:yes gene_type:complete